MASITIRNLKEETKKRLRLRAAESGHSVEAEARAVLDRGVMELPATTPKTGLDLFRGIREVVEKYGGVELDIPPRTKVRSAFLEEAGEFKDEPLPKPRRKRRK